jgi:hypothetical protein
VTVGEPPQSALRLTFAYSGDSIRLVASRAVDMLVPPSDPVDGYQGQTGFWAELRDSTGNVIYRRVMHDPISSYHEVHSLPGTPPTHTPVRNREGVFEIVVPALPAGATVVLFGTPHPPSTPIGEFAQERARTAGPRVGTGPASEIARFEMDEVRLA